MTDLNSNASASRSRLYRAVWRWHFYAGLVVAPFLLVLAITGLIMVWGNSVETLLGQRHPIAVPSAPASLVDQARAAAAAVPGGKVTMYVQPATQDVAGQFIVDSEDGSHVVAVDPQGPAVVGNMLRSETLFNWASKIHGTLLLGDFGDRVLEIAAGLGLILVLSGLYLFWPKGARGWRAALLPKLGKGRLALKNLHQTTGFWFALVLTFFLVSGLAWTGIWGGQLVQAWSTFPAAKWNDVPLSDKTHASMNHEGMKEVPWALEETPLPQSGSSAGVSGMPQGMAINLDSIVAFGRSIGFGGQFRVNLPADETGVYTLSADSMDGDTTNPTGDRTLHIDRYTGKILAEVRFGDYSIPGKAMAVGIALHQGNLGWWNILLNTLYCLAVVLIIASGIAMWWIRRPQGSLAAPRYTKAYKAPIGVLVIAAVVSAAFPLTGLAVIVFATIDFLLPRRFKEGGA